MKTLSQKIRECQRCSLSHKAKNKVIGKGNPLARVVLIGEAPGEEEDEKGIPFLGKAGRQLDKMLPKMGLNLENCYIMNVLKCRPYNNKITNESWLKRCRGWFEWQLDTLKPRLIICLGNVAWYSVYGEDSVSVTRAHGKIHLPAGSKLLPKVISHCHYIVPLFHPAYLLYNPSKTEEMDRGLEVVRKLVVEIEDYNKKEVEVQNGYDRLSERG